MDETWRPVLGFEGLYEVSDWGRVRSLDRAARGDQGSVRRIRGRDLRPFVQADGHLSSISSETTGDLTEPCTGSCSRPGAAPGLKAWRAATTTATRATTG